MFNLITSCFTQDWIKKLRLHGKEAPSLMWLQLIGEDLLVKLLDTLWSVENNLNFANDILIFYISK